MSSMRKVLAIFICFAGICATFSAAVEKQQDGTGEALRALRALMATAQNGSGKISAYIIPSEDEHQSEYVSAHDRRRAFISGFGGSAGSVVVTQTEALLWTDGRYYLQASQQLDDNWTLMKDGLPDVLTQNAWLASHCETGDVVGADPNLFSARMWASLAAALTNSGCVLKAILPNLVDIVWGAAQPVKPQNEIFTLNVKYAGKFTNDKLIAVREKMTEQRVSVLLVSALDEVAYFFNLRGNDMTNTPLFFSYAIVTLNELYLFVDDTKITDEILQHFMTNQVTVIVKKYAEVHDTFKTLVDAAQDKIWVSSGSSYALSSVVDREKLYAEITPIAVMKAIKNDIEASGMINSHVRDGVALVQYFSWLQNEVQSGRIVTELTGGDKLLEFRSTKENFMGKSFTTINAFGSNSAIIHYSPRPETDRQITDKEIYMCDSGGQYLDGTSDVTRSWHFGTPTDFEKEAFTRVLKGQILMGSSVFPSKIKGATLDTLARKSLWDVGLDYGHGTGHGIGMFLGVHEGPMGIGIRPATDDPGLQPNMFLSNEPGYYEDGKFGIRLEDIVQIVPISIGNNFNNRGALTFHTITLCPIQIQLIDVKLLSEKEIDYLNNYHKRVYETLHPLLPKSGTDLDSYTENWLWEQTRPIYSAGLSLRSFTLSLTVFLVLSFRMIFA